MTSTSYSTSLIGYSALWQLLKGLLVSVWTCVVMLAEQSYEGCVLDLNGYFLMHENILDLHNLYERDNQSVGIPAVASSKGVAALPKPILVRTKSISISPISKVASSSKLQPILMKQASNLHLTIPIISVQQEVEPSIPKLKKSPSKSIVHTTNTRFHQITPPISPLGNFTFPAVSSNSQTLLVPQFELLNTPPPQQSATNQDFKSTSFHTTSKKRLSFSAFSYEFNSTTTTRGRAATIQTIVPKPVIEIKRIKSNSHM
ncbi:predicted protein [Naegleria gruberi]|uniref:Predicted protein n=1 Tax=Naegleria gruberi TaxID=5762 RepID=D2W1B5_NAEGR|nr:uncharacterized protein NAEGRDRAFT_76624 [Naegleria gruberi]XP_002669941.1 uncharacterized protein NAEGRDRAFT_75156 [Naegleria gruberi]EFC35718.1 predicted protein [Naegleria gruberi]EFC37197.1 predicted protein [Naegleria gruberi]|eukprot:XP_002668462.1 predicted protein [Naegleria gruberi strain NEG-M]